eukprot:EG_transcript_19709
MIPPSRAGWGRLKKFPEPDRFDTKEAAKEPFLVIIKNSVRHLATVFKKLSTMFENSEHYFSGSADPGFRGVLKKPGNAVREERPLWRTQKSRFNNHAMDQMQDLSPNGKSQAQRRDQLLCRMGKGAQPSTSGRDRACVMMGG